MLRHRGHWNNKQFADAYDRRTHALRWAPHPWLRKLWNLRQHRHVSSNKLGRWIYAIYSTRTGKVYVGQTGDRGTLKSIVQRMRQHLTCARSWHTLYGTKGCDKLGSIYPAMANIGDEHFGIMALEQCAPGTANRRERWLIRKLSPTLNVRDVPTYSRRWELLFRANLVPKVPARERMRDTIHTLTTALRMNASPCDQLAQLQQVKKYGSQQEAHATFQKVKHRIAQHTSIHIPYRMPLRTPNLRAADGRLLRDHVTRYVNTLPIPTNLRSYYGTTISAIRVKGKSVSDMLCTPKLTCTIQELQDRAAGTCNCRALAQQHNLPLVDGHIVVRKPKDARALFGKQAAIVLQDVRSATVPSWYEAKSTFVRSVQHILHTLPVQRTSASEMYSQCLSHLKSAWHIEREVSPWFTRQEAVTQFADQWSPFYAFTPCDKNTGKVMVMCQCLYAARNIQLYSDPEQFEIIEQLDTHAAAKRHAMEVLYNRARDAGIHRFWKSGKGKGPL